MNEEEKKKKQIQTFITYINIQLEDRKKIENITDIYTGVDLFFFLRSLCEKYSKEFPILTELEIEDCDKPEVGQKNIQTVLDWLEKTEKLQFKDITSEGIYNKDEEMTISLIWHIIIYFHFFSGGYKYPKDDAVEVPVDFMTYYEDMVDWTNEILNEISGHSDDEIKELSDWKNGKALYSIIRTLYLNGERDEDADEELTSMDTEDSDMLVHSCIEFAAEKMGIPEVISIEEILEPEEISIAIYVHYLRMFDELNEMEATASERSEDTDDETEEVMLLRRSLEEERVIREEMSEEHKLETSRLEELVKEREDTIRSLSLRNTPNTSRLLDTSTSSNFSSVSVQSTASTRSTLKREMEKLKEGFIREKGDVLNDYKRQLRRVMMTQYEAGRKRNQEDLDLMKVQLEEKEKEIMDLKKEVLEGQKEVKKVRKDAEVKIQESKECCTIL